MKREPNYQRLENPFTPDRPVRQRSEFIGREGVLASIRDFVGGDISSKRKPAERSLVISGPPAIGKTSLLYQLVAGALGEKASVLYADFGEMDPSTFSTFLWQLAKAMMTSSGQQGFLTPHIEKRMLVLNPRLVFRQRFWNPLLSRAHSTPLILVWDNFDALMRQSPGNVNLPSLRAYLFDLLQTEAPIDLLLAITGRVEAVGEDALSPFRLGRNHRLTNLSREQTLRLIRKSEQMLVFEPVADFIFGLTSGHPGDTHRLCHSLYERHITRGQGQLTVADIVAVLREDLKPADFVGTVYHRLSIPSTVDR
jgi:hypothetical protein